MRDGHTSELDDVFSRLAGEPAEAAVFAESVLNARPILLPRNPRAREAAHDALIDEIVRIIARTSSYDPAKLSLVAFLRMVVRRKVLNHLRGVRRRRHHEAEAARRGSNPDLVATDEPPGNAIMEAEWDNAQLDAVRGELGEADLHFLNAVRAGGSPDELAKALECDDGDNVQMKATIRRAVDRITKKLRRKGLIP